MELLKINKIARFTLNSTIVLRYYFLTASNEKTTTILIDVGHLPNLSNFKIA
jgi:hypothetical protein